MFLPAERFPHTFRLQAAWNVIRAEGQTLPGGEFCPWPETALHDGGWSVYGLFAAGRAILANCVFCPETTKLLQHLPGVTNAGFSRLAAGSRIRPHTGYAGTVLRLHLGLVVPPGCGLRVGTETRSWQEGQCLLFDDKIDHEAWNGGDGDRLILLVDFQPDTDGTPS